MDVFQMKLSDLYYLRVKKVLFLHKKSLYEFGEHIDIFVLFERVSRIAVAIVNRKISVSKNAKN